MAPHDLAKLLELPADERAEIALALWDSLTDAQRDAEVELSDEDRAELDRRWGEHVRNPGADLPWSKVRARLLKGE
jgi:putative addiction module component (TIGR02574 family)